MCLPSRSSCRRPTALIRAGAPTARCAIPSSSARSREDDLGNRRAGGGSPVAPGAATWESCFARAPGIVVGFEAHPCRRSRGEGAIPSERARGVRNGSSLRFFFVVDPTAAPRPAEVNGEGFAVWGLRFLYSSDPPYNCFPSLHVAHSFVSALASYRVHRGVGIAATVCALLVGLSTLYTKQHYIADVLAGIGLALVACHVFLRNVSRAEVPELDRRLAPVFALGTLGIVTAGTLCFWAVYQLGGQP